MILTIILTYFSVALEVHCHQKRLIVLSTKRVYISKASLHRLFTSIDHFNCMCRKPIFQVLRSCNDWGTWETRRYGRFSNNIVGKPVYNLQFCWMQMTTLLNKQDQVKTGSAWPVEI